MDYTTLTSVLTEKNIPIEQSGDNALLRRYIRVASRLIDIWTGRSFFPSLWTGYFERAHMLNPYVIRLGEDLLEVTTLTNGDGVAVEAANYVLKPRNAYPKRRIDLKTSSNLTWQIPYLESEIAIAGVWGYHTDYLSAWGNSGDTVENNPLTASGTEVTINNSEGLDERGFTRFSVGDYLKFGSTNDFAQIQEIGLNTMTVQRGIGGSTPAEHAQNTAIYTYRQLDDVIFMANEITRWLYDHRDTVQASVQLAPELGVVIVRELPEVKALAESYHPRAEGIRAV